MSQSTISVPVEQLRSLRNQLQQMLEQPVSTTTKISCVSHASSLHCGQETKLVVIGKVGVSGKLKAVNYDLIGKDQYWGNRHGSMFEVCIQRGNEKLCTSGDTWCSRYDSCPSHTDVPNDHFNHHITLSSDVIVDANDEICVVLKGLYPGHTVELNNIHIRLAVEH